MGKEFEDGKSSKEEVNKILISSYYFDYMINIGVFRRLRERIRDLISIKHEEIFYPKKSSPNFPLLMKNMVEKHFEGKRDLVILKKSGEDDPFFDFVSNFIDNFNFENFIEFENRYALIYYFTELDIYLFRCFKFILTKKPDILNNTNVSLKELREVNGNIKKVIEDKAEEKAMSKFDLNLFIDEVPGMIGRNNTQNHALAKANQETGEFFRNQNGFYIKCEPGDVGMSLMKIQDIKNFRKYSDMEKTNQKVIHVILGTEYAGYTPSEVSDSAWIKWAQEAQEAQVSSFPGSRISATLFEKVNSKSDLLGNLVKKDGKEITIEKTIGPNEDVIKITYQEGLK